MDDWVIISLGKNLLSRPNLLGSKMIAIFGCICKTINDVKLICLTLGLSNYFSLKSVSLSLKSHMNVP